MKSTKEILPPVNRKIAILLIVACTFLAHGRSLDNDFVGDDILIIGRSELIKSWQNFPLLFNQSYLTSPAEAYTEGPLMSSGEATYRPIVTLTYFFDYSLWHLKPFGYHLTNLIIHALSAILLFFWARYLIAHNGWSLLAALVFATHPIQAEAVNNIGYRDDLLVVLLSLSSFMMFIKYRGRTTSKAFYQVMASLLFFLALLSKEMAFILPAMLILYDVYFSKRRDWKSFLKSYAGYAMVSVVILWIWLGVMPSENELLLFENQTMYTNVLTMIKVFGIYLFWLILPIGIHPTIPDAAMAEYSLFSLHVLIPLLLIVGCFYYAFKTRFTHKVSSFAILIFFAGIIPVSNIIALQNVLAARYLYFSMIGFALFIACLGQQLSEKDMSRMAQKLFKFGLLGMIMVYCFSSAGLSLIWKNGDTFFLELSRHYPETEWIPIGLGRSFVDQGRYDEAIVEFKKAKQLAPEYVDNYDKLGRIYLIKGRFNEAAEEFRYVVEHDSRRKEAFFNLCFVLGRQNKYDEASNCFEQLIEEHPNFSKAYTYLEVLKHQTIK